MKARRVCLLIAIYTLVVISVWGSEFLEYTLQEVIAAASVTEYRNYPMLNRWGFDVSDAIRIRTDITNEHPYFAKLKLDREIFPPFTYGIADINEEHRDKAKAVYDWARETHVNFKFSYPISLKACTILGVKPLVYISNSENADYEKAILDYRLVTEQAPEIFPEDPYSNLCLNNLQIVCLINWASRGSERIQLPIVKQAFSQFIL